MYVFYQIIKNKWKCINQLILKNLDCDALLEGTITEFKNNFYLAYSSTNVGLSLFLKDKDKRDIDNLMKKYFCKKK